MSYFTSDMDISKAIRKFFKSKDGKTRSYYQYKGILFKTESIDYSGFVPFSLEELQRLINNFKILYWNEKEVIKLLNIKKLEQELDEIKKTLDQIDDPEEKFRIERELLSDMFRVNTFNKVKVSFASDICMFWCPYCKEIFFERDIVIDTKYNYPKCPKCDKILQQTPIWILKNETDRAIITPFTVWINGYNLKYLWKKWFDRDYIECIKCENGKLKKYISLDQARIFESSRLVCDRCENNYGLYSQNYSLAAPSENITIPFIATTFSKSTIYLNSIDLKSKLIKLPIFNTEYVDKFLFTPKIRVKELIIGFWHGLYIKRIIESEKTGMELTTSGIYLKLKEEYFSMALEFLKEVYRENPDLQKWIEKATILDIKRRVLHSLAHAILSKLPIYSGLSIDNFSYFYDINENSILIYERCQGGLGASYILTQMQEEKSEPIILDFLVRIRDTLKSCNCDDRCKYCLALSGCQEFNHYLNRFALGPLFNLKTEDLSWGF
ncbi:hypothetical protein DRN73_09020 [Candidatus Pacearchaeota archaeon]|nr:MAG: hypothetical protein DRN73_09020 [Candidatus Pacearchaeota archaeon]